MLSRALVVALWCACVAALTPLSAVGDDNECALYLAGPGRTSAYDYSLNLLRGNVGYEGQHTCITYDAVNQAYLEARKRILVAQPKGDWKPEDFASVGELILDISINLARTYGLTYEEIEKGLPLIDTSRTLIREVCPPVFSHVECRAGKYRRADGLCNNLQNPTWGSTNTPFQRLIGPLFSDGINAPRISHTGRDLPLSRVVSRTMHPDDGFHDHAGTVMVIAWGQFMDHDYTLTGTPLDPVNRNDPEECCKRPLHLKHPYCNEIRVPDDDYFYRLFGVKCIDFVRGFPSPRPGCRLGSRVPFNTLTGAIDGNTVYGVTEKFSRKLRAGYGGLLRMNTVFKEYGLKELLPLKLDIPDEGCTRPNNNMFCFEAGEIRVNEQLVLTVMHTLMAREHNRVAEALAEVNPHWDDETLFQEARRINIAEIQHITYNEFLPILLGKDVMEKFGLVLQKENYWEGYDPTVNPDVIDAFAAAAYRFGHSLLPTAVERWSKAHKFIASKRLSDLIRRPYDLYRAGVLDEYVMGLMNQVAQAMDDSITQEVTNHLFKKVGAKFGMDLVSFNMQRGREFGLPGYMEFRKFCGLSGANSFQDLHGSMPNDTVRRYESIFEHPIDVDLWSGGVSERPLPGSMLGPTFACIIATQFSYSRRGDRFWFELPNQPSSFTPEQLAEIRKSRLARIICDNTDIIDTVQLYPMVLPDHELNPRVPCRSGIIPSMDFSKWAEPAPFAGAAKQFMTEANISTKNESDLCEEQIATVNVTPTIVENDCEDHNVTLDVNHNQPCNDTEEVLASQQEQQQQREQLQSDLINHQTPCNDEVVNVATQNNDCIQVTQSNDCTENNTNLNEVVDNDTVLKYVYKKKDNITIPEKSRGHAKNSIKRRKRSYDRESQSHHTKPTQNIVSNDYKPVLHKDREILSSLRVQDTPNVARADFNIETLHENLPNGKSSNKFLANIQEGNKRTEYRDSRNNKYKENTESGGTRRNGREEYINSRNRKYKENEESGERRESDRDAYRDSRNKQYRESPGSGERIEYNRRAPQRYQDSHESNERDSRENRFENSNENSKSNENGKYINRASNEEVKESDERDERDDYKSGSKPTYKKSSDESLESGEKDNKYLSPKNRHKPAEYSKERESSESNEDSQENRHDKYKEELKSRSNDSSQPKIQDVDLDDFSHERIQVNDKGEVETAKDTYANYETDSSLEAKTSKPEIDSKESNERQSQSLEATEEQLSQEIDNPKQPIRINDEEIKPVVEINSEGESGELAERNEEKTNSNLNNEDKNQESSDAKKETESVEQNEKTVARTDKKEDVKQEFERIPLNYNHDKKTEKHDDEEASDKTLPIATKTKNDDESQNDGTLDSLSNDHYDENLNIKFDDVTIKLPEIKLPEDILAYNYEEPPYFKEEEKQRYHYDEDEDHNARIQKKKKKNDNDDDESDDNVNDDDSPGFRDYYYNDAEKQNYKEKENKQDDDEEEEEDDEENVDLYEKFVRERFGKKGSFEQRSEKLQDTRHLPENPALFDTVQKILKKTEETQNEAEKSGDPNAEYVWTLEYGENL